MKVTEWKELPILNDNSCIYQLLPKFAKVNTSTQLEFHKHCIVNNKPIIEKIEVKHEIVNKGNEYYVKIHDVAKYIENDIDVHFFIETDIQNNELIK